MYLLKESAAGRWKMVEYIPEDKHLRWRRDSYTELARDDPSGCIIAIVHVMNDDLVRYDYIHVDEVRWHHANSN